VRHCIAGTFPFKESCHFVSSQPPFQHRSQQTIHRISLRKPFAPYRMLRKRNRLIVSACPSGEKNSKKGGPRSRTLGIKGVALSACSHFERNVSSVFRREIQQMSTALFWVIRQRVVVIHYLLFGNCSETSLRNYHQSLRNTGVLISP